MENDFNPEELIAEIHKGRNFRSMDQQLTRQLIVREMHSSNNRKEIVKNVKSKLYQIASAFRNEKIEDPKLFDSFADQTWQDQEAVKEQCLRLMKNHASTRERMPILEEFYRTIFSNLPPIDSVLDLACGLNPLSIPWMPLEKNFSYEAYDVFQDLMDLINAFFHRFQIHGMATQMNLLENYPRKQAALTLLLKTIPCLEQVDKNAGKKILSQIESKFAVISFPAHSLSGKNKGMPKNYESHFLEICNPDVWEIQKILFPSELVFLIKRK
ncbi:class I SAM-dependent methyltransferase [Flexilinea flocculi]|jgi:16S rRNA (guanine(1405)-N(7))-methyltransferase|uniref:16S rRNA (guanine(1405)-N(7))-methyltransferase n=1 Tax=Flexilinea flocculi TaxID=1678840 RepID=A0A0K8PBR4_9CHLR|nr:hypothetical protein [Flexilinea flocculi]GAP39590.1 ribosomal RNA methyltransferase [Flexilinea flocculi]